MNNYRLKRPKKSRDLSTFEPVDWVNLYDVDASVQAMLARFERDVLNEMKMNGIEFPLPVKSVRTTLGKWSGFQSDELIEKLGSLACNGGYKATVLFDVEHEHIDEDLLRETERKIEKMIENSSYLQLLMKNHECIITAEYECDWGKITNAPTTSGIDG